MSESAEQARRDADAGGTGPTGSDAGLSPAGRAVWAQGRVDLEWSLRDVSNLHHLMGHTAGAAVFLVAKARVRGLFERLLWIQYAEALLNGKVYVPEPTPQNPHAWPWRGIDRYPNNDRPDKLPYACLPDEQRRVDRGHGYDGRVRSLYTPDGADSVDIDWASSGGMLDWGHSSVLTLIGRGPGGDEWALGSLLWRWSVDGQGLLRFGARPAETADRAVWLDCLRQGNAQYVRDVFRGEWRP